MQVFPNSLNTSLTLPTPLLESVPNRSSTVYFSVRARALGSFLSAAVAIIGGNLLGVCPLEIPHPHTPLT